MNDVEEESNTRGFITFWALSLMIFAACYKIGGNNIGQELVPLAMIYGYGNYWIFLFAFKRPMSVPKSGKTFNYGEGTFYRSLLFVLGLLLSWTGLYAVANA